MNPSHARPVLVRPVEWARRIGLALVIWLLGASAVQAQVTTLYSFTSKAGLQPQGELSQASDGAFYGTTFAGGPSDNGTIFRMTADGTVTPLFSFDGANGRRPFGPPVEAPDGNFYGTTSEGGANGLGTIYRLTRAGALTTVLNFDGPNGDRPQSRMIVAADGNLYGTTYGGGTGGTAFRLTTAGVHTVLTSFDCATGTNPQAPLFQAADGNFYGTTTSCGAGWGTVYRLTPTGTLTVLASFNAVNGAFPTAGVVQGNDGHLYGVTRASSGGTGNGTLYRVTLAGVLTKLVDFTISNGANPYSSMIKGSDGFLYGTTSYGGGPGYPSGVGIVGTGTVFRFDTATSALTTLKVFDELKTYPSALVLARDGKFYGTTAEGGTAGLGSAFAISPAASYELLYSFSFENGAAPNAGLLLARDGNAYGTAREGGAFNAGTVFRFTPAGEVTALVSFNGANGRQPLAELIEGPDGALYGTTDQGGADDKGTVFRIDPSGTLTTLVSFDGVNGAAPYASLVVGPDSLLYGTTPRGGTADLGTVFRLGTTGGLTTLVNFEPPLENRIPLAELIVGDDGNFYGTTSGGGSRNTGTVFRVTAGGAITTLAEISIDEGQNIAAGLVQARDGNFYGSVRDSAGPFLGHLFRMTPEGALTTLVRFDRTNGASPEATLIEAPDGTLYGTTFSGGEFSLGTAFSLDTTSGAFRTLASFDVPVGTEPNRLALGFDGNLYGTTQRGGDGFKGTIFRLAILSAPTQLTATGGDRSVSLQWNAPPSGATFDVYMGTTSGGQSATPVATGVTGNTTTITGLANGTAYYFTVRAVRGSDRSEASNEASATPQLASLLPPTNLVATAGNAAVGLSWTASLGATRYTVYQSLTPGAGTLGMVATSTTATDVVIPGLANGATYYYVVTATFDPPSGAPVVSPASNEASATPFDPAPAAPTGLSASARDRSVTLSWTGSSGATSYDVYQGTASGGQSATPVLSGVPGTTATVSGLVNGTRYYYVVTARSPGGVSARSNEASAVPQPAPAPPTRLSAVGGPQSVSLQWTASAGATSYNIYQGTSPGGQAATPVRTGVAGTSTTLTGLTDGTLYYFTVAAVGPGGTSAASNEAGARAGASGSSGGGGGGGGGGSWSVLSTLLLLIAASVRRSVSTRGLEPRA